MDDHRKVEPTSGDDLFPYVMLGMGMWMEEIRVTLAEADDTLATLLPVTAFMRNYVIHLLWLEKVYGYVRMKELHDKCCEMYQTPDNFSNLLIESLPIARSAFGGDVDDSLPLARRND